MKTSDVHHSVAYNRLSKNVSRFYNLNYWPYILAILLLILVSVYSGLKAIHTYSTNSDALVYTYLLSGAHGHQIVLPGQHSNLLKLPFFWVTSWFTYSYHAFLLENLIIFLATIGLWTWLLIRLFGKQYALLIMVAFAGLILSSTQLNINIAESTIRNIEFPLALWFILIINDLVKGIKLTRNRLIVASVGFVIYSLMVAGDTYFMYTISLPLLILLAWYWVQSKRFNRSMLNAGVTVIASLVLSVLIKMFLTVTGLLVINKTITFPVTIVSTSNLLPSIGTALTQLLQLQGADIFGKEVNLHNFSLFFNLFILILGIIGIFTVLVSESYKYRKAEKIHSENGYVYAVLAASFFVTFFIYVLSGQVVGNVNGHIVSLGQLRYIAFLPFLTLVGFIWLIKNFYSSRKLLIALFIAGFLIEMITVIPTTRSTYAATINSIEPSYSILNSQIAYLNQQHVSEVLTGYWDGTPIRFESNNSIRFAAIVDCNHPFTFNVREDWYKANANTKISALVIDRTGPDTPYWNNCSDSQIENIYGTPIAKRNIGYTDIWVYHFDVRQKLQPYKTVYY